MPSSVDLAVRIAHRFFWSNFSLKRKARFFRSLLVGRRCTAASRFIFFRDKMLDLLSLGNKLDSVKKILFL